MSVGRGEGSLGPAAWLGGQFDRTLEECGGGRQPGA
jgi:hypothetical protein